jgi:TorA-specific chaperone
MVANRLQHRCCPDYSQGRSMNLVADLNPAEARRYLETLIWLSQVFWGPGASPTVELFNQSLPGEIEEISRILERFGLGAGVEAAVELSGWLKGHQDTAQLGRELEEAYVRLFVSGQQGVAAPLFQSCYEGDGLMMGPAHARMAGRLAERGLTWPGEGAQPADHVAAQLEYLFLLLESELAEPAGGGSGQAAEFASMEMAAWVAQWCERLQVADNASLYPAAARLARAMISLASDGADIKSI